MECFYRSVYRWIVYSRGCLLIGCLLSEFWILKESWMVLLLLPKQSKSVAHINAKEAGIDERCCVHAHISGGDEQTREKRTR